MQPIENNRKLTSFFFISAFVLSNLVMMNLIIAVLVERFLKEKNKTCKIFNK